MTFRIRHLLLQNPTMRKMTRVSRADELLDHLEKIDGIAKKEQWASDKEKQVKKNLIDHWETERPPEN